MINSLEQRNGQNPEHKVMTPAEAGQQLAGYLCLMQEHFLNIGRDSSPRFYADQMRFIMPSEGMDGGETTFDLVSVRRSGFGIRPWGRPTFAVDMLHASKGIFRIPQGGPTSDEDNAQIAGITRKILHTSKYPAILIGYNKIDGGKCRVFVDISEKNIWGFEAKKGPRFGGSELNAALYT